MAEIKTGIFAKNVQKRLSRAQEKVLQKLGKADETKDEQFEQVVVNFKRQESEGSRLQREMKAYMAAIKGMQQASINLSESLHEVYEPDWYGKDDVMVLGKDSDALWEDFHNKLVDSTLLNLDGYLTQFPDLKTRVAKRSRKLIDYDSARHHMETLQASGMKNDRKMVKAEEELKKAQKVFDELNVGLQDELPTLWDSRVGFYVNTFKNVTSLEAKFHREISLLCKQLYEVMTKLGEQHSDKMFTIQGAPRRSSKRPKRDSGPLRLARTPSPPDDDDDSPPTSPEMGTNHMLMPHSPGPPRPKSPMQGPPVPPPPKATPTREVAQEQIIDLFGGDFLPAPTPSQPNERPGESLMDLDFDAFQPDDSVSPIPQTAVPWDMWSGSAQPAQPAADSGFGFVADWSADFGGAGANGDGPVAPAAAESAGWPAAEASPAAGPADEAQAWPAAEAEASPARGPDDAQAWHAGGGWAEQEPEDTAAATPPPAAAEEAPTAAAAVDAPPAAAAEEAPPAAAAEAPPPAEAPLQPLETAASPTSAAPVEVSGPAPDPITNPGFHFPAIGGDVARPQGGGPTHPTGAEEEEGEEQGEEEWEEEEEEEEELVARAAGGGPTGEEAGRAMEDRRKSTPGLIITNEHGEEIEDRTEGGGAYGWGGPCSSEDSGSEYGTSEEWGGGGQEEGGWAGGDADEYTPKGSHGGWEADDDGFVADGFAADWSQTPGGPAEYQGPDPSAQGTGGGAGKAPSTESPAAGGFNSDLFADTPGGGFDADPFGGFQRDPFAQENGGFPSDPFAETQGGDALGPGPGASPPTSGPPGRSGLSVTFADPEPGAGGGDPAARSDPFGPSPAGDAFLADFNSDPFGEGGGGGGGGGGTGWDSDPFAEGFKASFPDAGGADGVGAGGWQEVGAGGVGEDEDDFGECGDTFLPESSGGPDAAAYVVVPRPHREPESSDMSEDEAANKRYGRLYQDIETEKDEGTNAFNGFAQEEAGSSFFADFDNMKDSGDAVKSPLTTNTAAPLVDEAAAEAPAATVLASEEDEPLVEATSPLEAEAEGAEAAGDMPEDVTAATAEEPVDRSSAETQAEEVDASPTEAVVVEEVKEEVKEEVTEEVKDEVKEVVTAEVKEEVKEVTPTSPKEEEKLASPVSAPVEVAVPEPDIIQIPTAEEDKMTSSSETDPLESATTPEERRESPMEDSSKTMPIPSVVIEPASSNEGDDDRDGDIISPVAAISDNGVMATEAKVSGAAAGGHGLPDGFLYKVETMHDFEAANSDELELKRGDMVLVVPTALLEDQDAGWLTGFKESDWKTLGTAAPRGLFPENFTQRVD
ncbi:amphiphysin isoform X3 [Gadus morhua]|uniref:amphiphysin isoform X3 n=1 Tax=Gadus morhua TaxID=8049 RepID=UPI0011B49DA6|nr:uncharacterized protein LOC115549167 isoform X3 [Gadus morhua]